MVEQAPVREAERVIDAEFTEKTEGKEELPVKTEKVVLPEGTIEFELDEEEHLFDVGEVTPTGENFNSGGEGEGICPDLPRTTALLFPGRKLAGNGRNHLSGRN